MQKWSVHIVSSLCLHACLPVCPALVDILFNSTLLVYRHRLTVVADGATLYYCICACNFELAVNVVCMDFDSPSCMQALALCQYVPVWWVCRLY